MNQYYYDDGGNRTKLVHMNAVYSKDGNGRIVSMLTKASASPQGLTKTYLYANFTELTKMTASEYGGTTRDYTYEHDNAGRLTRQVQNVFSPNSTTTFNYEWDALDRMTKVQRVASGVTKTINYTYNAAGLRVRRVDTSTNVTKLWTYQGNNIASVSTKSGGSFGDTSTQEWVYTVGPGMINNVLERHKANYAAGTTTSEYYQYDHRGNVAAVTDYSGKILRGYQYDAFGNIPFSFATGQSGAAPTDDILFTGKDYDSDTGLYYFNARWYDSDTGRFISRTAKYSPNKERPYAFCMNNPLIFVDVNGQMWEWIGAAAGVVGVGVLLIICPPAGAGAAMFYAGAGAVAGGGAGATYEYFWGTGKDKRTESCKCRCDDLYKNNPGMEAEVWEPMLQQCRDWCDQNPGKGPKKNPYLLDSSGNLIPIPIEDPGKHLLPGDSSGNDITWDV
jgi:RHS repeat-associated protein